MRRFVGPLVVRGIEECIDGVTHVHASSMRAYGQDQAADALISKQFA